MRESLGWECAGDELTQEGHRPEFPATLSIACCAEPPVSQASTVPNPTAAVAINAGISSRNEVEAVSGLDPRRRHSLRRYHSDQVRTVFMCTLLNKKQLAPAVCARHRGLSQRIEDSCGDREGG